MVSVLLLTKIINSAVHYQKQIILNFRLHTCVEALSLLIILDVGSHLMLVIKTLLLALLLFLFLGQNRTQEKMSFYLPLLLSFVRTSELHQIFVHIWFCYVNMWFELLLLLGAFKMSPAFSSERIVHLFWSCL